ncbi:carbon storage regulator CsrA [Tundrisphaera lichenicola]|uniref:carbon storage regulator CsrA n=1 Tax=Tundrisphaera lichenicola TaxID=2029860 RepID=UPI003EBB0317
MLVLSRKLNESIVIGGNIRITVASVTGRCVRIGIEAPKEVAIYREELCPGGTDDLTTPERDIRHKGRAS